MFLILIYFKTSEMKILLKNLFFNFFFLPLVSHIGNVFIGVRKISYWDYLPVLMGHFF